MEENINNLFRSNTQFIKNNFINSLVGNQVNESTYVKATIPYDWTIYGVSKTIKKVKKPSYEDRLKEIMETKSDEKLKLPIYVTIGGIGSGKTTIYKYALSKSKTCHNCTTNDICDHNPFILTFDFINIKRLSTGSKQNQFWMIITSNLRSLITIKEDEEVTKFWKWLIERNIYTMIEPLYKKLEANKPFIIKDEPNVNDLLNERKDLIDKTLTIEEICIYQLYILRYQRRNYNNLCHLAVLDNLDNIIPADQHSAIDFGYKLFDILHCPVLIPMRPFTYAKHHGAYDFYEVIDHYSPDLFEVLEKRSDELMKSGNTTADILGSICKIIIKKIKSDSTFSKLFESTSGVSVRFALRNYYNLLLSHLLQAEDNGTTNVEKWKSNEFYEAFLCHEMLNNLMDSKNFCNLYTINIPEVPVYYSNLKIRFLNRLFSLTEKNISLLKIYKEINAFGYTDDEFLSVINDLLDDERPLIYSNMFPKYDSIDQIDQNHGIMLSPMGDKYYKLLINEPQYIKECIFQKEQSRFDKKLEDWLPKSKDLLDFLFEKDKIEIQNFISKKSVSEYLKIFPEYSSISLELWNKHLEMLEGHGSLFHFYDLVKIDYDKDYKNFIQKETKDILSIFL